MIDLHTHSTASDGSLSPAALVACAHECRITRLALTDHDTVSGLAEARDAGRKLGVDIVDGVEISATWANRTLHILGLGIDPGNSQLVAGLRAAAIARTERAREIGRRLEAAGVSEAWTLTRELAGDGLIGRAHFASMLVNHKHAKDNTQVFKRFMVQGKPGYVPASWMPMEKAVALIRDSGGVAVLAHPVAYALTTRKLRAAIEEFADAGGEGMEVVSGRIEPADVIRLARLAEEFGLWASAGSDYHGPDKPWLKLGHVPALPSGSRPVWEHPALKRP